MPVLYFSDVLRKTGLAPDRVKLIRYTPQNDGFFLCRQQNMVAEYAAHQHPGFGDDYDWFAVFIGEHGTGARLYGLYRVGPAVADSKDVMPEGYPFPESFRGENVFYTLTRDDRLAEYEQRLVINWGGATALWHQNGLNEKPITALTAAEPFPFPGYEKLVLTFDQLQQIAQGDPVYESWQAALSSTKAVFLVCDAQSGKCSVGATCGDQNLMGRWRHFVVTRHGGIPRLAELLRRCPERYKSLRFSILQALPLATPDKAIEALQSLYQQKLCSREQGFDD